jgi:hypothetical protein
VTGSVGTLDLPTFVVVGAPRCGTTALNFYLAQHPEIAMATPKETHFFDRNFDRGIDWYSARFRRTNATRLLGEATPLYMSNFVALDRLCQAFPQARIVAILRDPIARANSHFHYRVARGLDSGTLADAIRRELEGPADSFPYLKIGRYAEQIAELDRLFGRDHLHLAWQTELLQSPQEVVNGIVSFLGLTPFENMQVRPQVNAADAFRSLALRRATKRAPKRVRDLIGRVNRRPLEAPPVPASSLKELRAYFEPTVRQLESRTGKDLSSWCTQAMGTAGGK